MTRCQEEEFLACWEVWLTLLIFCNVQIAPKKRCACFSKHPVPPVSTDLLGLKPPFANHLYHQGTESFPSLPSLPNAAEACDVFSACQAA